ncbi:PEGA domain-containing protein [Puniceicoccus vermicola]|uniref:PEGA domain-containing protein n=1 Tax=Puniceicoccus vermicola TaxID=388746 RepID=A0A7X1AWU6_9BACT|nr:PEGA domain-containing protein [Puniceicoccus vermicola]MBC2601441.1 PEGA domain-containing protein [Puniceicoccus vermicola]
MSIRFRRCEVLSPGRLGAIVSLLASLFLGGCGIGSNQTVDVDTRPTGAYVYVDGKFIGNSPVDVSLNRQVPHRVEVRKVGFVSEEVMVFPSVTEGGEPKVVFGPLRESGYYRDLDPNPVSVDMTYEGLMGYGSTLTEEEADKLIQRIQKEREAGELTDGEAAIALTQVQERMK